MLRKRFTRTAHIDVYSCTHSVTMQQSTFRNNITHNHNDFTHKHTHTQWHALTDLNQHICITKSHTLWSLCPRPSPVPTFVSLSLTLLSHSLFLSLARLCLFLAQLWLSLSLFLFPASLSLTCPPRDLPSALLFRHPYPSNA